MVKKHNKLNHFLLTFFSVHLTGISNTFILKKGQKPRIPLERRNLPKKLVKYYTLSDWLITATIMQSGPCPTSSGTPTRFLEFAYVTICHTILINVARLTWQQAKTEIKRILCALDAVHFIIIYKKLVNSFHLPSVKKEVRALAFTQNT